MKHKVSLAAATSLALCASAGSGLAFPASPVQASHAIPNVQMVTFWGEAFPYGYDWSIERACTRYEPFETPHGTEVRRVWVCNDKLRRYR